jgi:hypothetical protein
MMQSFFKRSYKLRSEVLDEAKIQFAEIRILGIRSELDHALKQQVAQVIGLDKAKRLRILASTVYLWHIL